MILSLFIMAGWLTLAVINMITEKHDILLLWFATYTICIAYLQVIILSQ